MKVNDRTRKISCFILMAGLMSGCASIMSGTSQQLSFQSNPDEATVTVNGRVIGKTPVSTSMKKASGQSLVFEKEGYKPLSMALETRLNSWFWGNIVLGGVVGSTTDGISGAVYEYSPSQYMVTLQPEGTSQMDSKTSLTDRQKAKEFIVVGYKNIVSDLNKGEGQYLSSLLRLLKVAPDQNDQAAKKILALSNVYTDIPEFADRVIELYMK